MAANVRCAGGGDTVAPPFERDGDPCGWKGERFAIGKRVGVSYFRWDNEDRIARTRKPCPQCGGRVALVEEKA